jgi:hypothetical protein
MDCHTSDARQPPLSATCRTPSVASCGPGRAPIRSARPRAGRRVERRFRLGCPSIALDGALEDHHSSLSLISGWRTRRRDRPAAGRGARPGGDVGQSVGTHRSRPGGFSAGCGWPVEAALPRSVERVQRRSPCALASPMPSATKHAIPPRCRRRCATPPMPGADTSRIRAVSWPSA